MNINKNLTVAEFNTLYKNQIKQYSLGVWALADLLHIACNKFGRNNLKQMINLPTSKMDWLINISKLKTRNLDVLPENHAELVGIKDIKNAKQWLTKSAEQRLKSTELRKQIRQSLSKHNNNDNDIKINNTISKHLMLLDLQLKQYPNLKQDVINKVNDICKT